MASSYDTNPTGHALMRKVLVSDDQYDVGSGLVGSVIKSGEPLLIPVIEPENVKAITLPALEMVEQVGIQSILIVRSSAGTALGRCSVFPAILGANLSRWKINLL